MIEKVLTWLVDFVHHFGYGGIFIMTLLESTFVPIPSEATVVPAGYLVHQGKMNFWLVWISGTLGTLAGSLINYWIAFTMGRSLVLRYGKYFFLSEAKLHKVEDFFGKYGAISTFTGRLITGVRHFIAFPAGLAKMPLKPFILYTLLGGALWVAILILVGYLVGENKEMVVLYVPYIKVAVALLAALFFGLHILKRSQRKPWPWRNKA